MDKKSSVEKIEAKTGLIASLINNGRTIVVALVAIVAIIIAVASGDGRTSLCRIYFQIVDESSKPWLPLMQQWSDAWLVVEDVLQRDNHQQTVTADNVETQKISDKHYRFRWNADDVFKQVDVEQDNNGVWHVNTLPDEPPGWCA